MHIDWFVFFAQIVNFLILLFLLKRFLYRRILQAIDLREAKIAERFAQAEKARAEAEATLARHQEEVRAFEASSRERLDKARSDAEQHRRELMDEVRREIEHLQTSWVETLSAERVNLLQELRRLAGTEVIAVARQVLRDLADATLEERIAAVLARRIEGLNREERERIRSLAAEGAPVKILSAMTLPDEARERLTAAIHRSLEPGCGAVQFDRADDILAGCELRIDGYKVAWSVRDYLDALEERFRLFLDRDIGRNDRRETAGGTRDETGTGGRGPVVS